MKKTWITAIIGLLCCTGMLLVDALWQPGYWVKSLVKIGLFLIVPIILSKYVLKLQLHTLFRLEKKGFLPALGLGLCVYGLIVGGYFLLKGFVDFSGIAGNLSANAGVTGENFLYVSLYISFANSLLEEFFFRGFLIRGLCGKELAWGFSAVAFSLYHTAMMAGWFDLWLFALALLGLAVGGLLFTWLNRRGSIYTSWLTHMCANFAINTIGFILL